ncbi:hypothetical protein BDR22DRAFT_247957 [Usnea florida]
MLLGYIYYLFLLPKGTTVFNEPIPDIERPHELIAKPPPSFVEPRSSFNAPHPPPPLILR